MAISIWRWRLLFALLLSTVLFYALIFLFEGFHQESTRLAIRWSARFAAVFFCAAFGASTFQHFGKGGFTYWLRMNRKYFGIAYAITHFFHLGFLVLLQNYFHPVFTLAKTTSLMAGGMAYFFAGTMLLTSFDAFSRHLSPSQWKWLHTIGGWWIWGIFVKSYAKNALSYPGYMVIFLLLAVTALLKVIRYSQKANRGMQHEKG